MLQGVASVTPFSYTLTEGGMLWVGWYLPVASLSVVPSAFSLPVLLWLTTQGWRIGSRKSADIRSLEPFFCKWIDYCKQICYNNYVKFLCFPKGNHSLSDLYSVIYPVWGEWHFFCFLPIHFGHKPVVSLGLLAFVIYLGGWAVTKERSIAMLDKSQDSYFTTFGT